MELHFSFMRFCTSFVITCLFFSYAASDDSSYSWQSVQQNMRMRGGDYKTGISNEGVCKTRCVQNPSCIGVDWLAEYSSCFFSYDSIASPYSANGYRHWRIIRNRPTLFISQGTRKPSTASVRSATPIVSQFPRSVDEDKNTDVVNGFYSWQPVQNDMRSRTGDYQTGTSDEDSCKARCVRHPNCTGVDWRNSETVCFLLYDCDASPYTELGFRHWQIRRYKATPITCQDLLRRELPTPHPTASMLCHSQDNMTTVVKALSVLLAVSAVVIAALIYNTWRLHQKIRNCTCQVKRANFAHKAQENGYQSYNGAVAQPAPYTDMFRTLPPIPNETEILYAAIDEDQHA